MLVSRHPAAKSMCTDNNRHTDDQVSLWNSTKSLLVLAAKSIHDVSSTNLWMTQTQGKFAWFFCLTWIKTMLPTHEPERKPAYVATATNGENGSAQRHHQVKKNSFLMLVIWFPCPFPRTHCDLFMQAPMQEILGNTVDPVLRTSCSTVPKTRYAIGCVLALPCHSKKLCWDVCVCKYKHARQHSLCIISIHVSCLSYSFTTRHTHPLHKVDELFDEGRPVHWNKFQHDKPRQRQCHDQMQIILSESGPRTQYSGWISFELRIALALRSLTSGGLPFGFVHAPFASRGASDTWLWKNPDRYNFVVYHHMALSESHRHAVESCAPPCSSHCEYDEWCDDDMYLFSSHTICDSGNAWNLAIKKETSCNFEFWREYAKCCWKCKKANVHTTKEQSISCRVRTCAVCRVHQYTHTRENMNFVLIHGHMHDEFFILFHIHLRKTYAYIHTIIVHIFTYTAVFWSRCVKSSPRQTHMHICIEIHIHMHMQICIYTCTHTCILPYRWYTCAYILTHTYIRTYMRTCVHAYTHTRMYTRTCIHAYTRIHVYMYTCTRIHARLHTHIHP